MISRFLRPLVLSVGLALPLVQAASADARPLAAEEATSLDKAASSYLRAVERGAAGPFHLALSVQDGRLAMEVATTDGAPVETLVLGLARFRRPIREYFAICDSYYQAIRKATAAEIETIDMARRGIHNHAAELLLERLEGKVDTDFATARRLFTLICVLHIKG